MADFPTTLGALDTDHNGFTSYTDAFVAKLNATGKTSMLPT